MALANVFPICIMILFNGKRCPNARRELFIKDFFSGEILYNNVLSS